MEQQKYIYKDLCLCRWNKPEPEEGWVWMTLAEFEEILANLPQPEVIEEEPIIE